MVFVQDVRHRAVYWIYFPVLLVLSVYLSMPQLNWMDLALNLGVIVAMILGLTLYLSIKMHKLTSPMNGYFAWGDVLFLLSVSPLFQLNTLIFFITTGSCFALLVHLALTLLKKTTPEIPFAGYLSLYLIGWLLFIQYYQIPGF